MAKNIQEIATTYFKRFSDFSLNIENENFSSNLKTIIVIPCFKEKEIIATLESLANCDSPKNETLVLILVNASEDTCKSIKEFNQNTFTEIESFIKKNASKNLKFKVFINNEQAKKHAGVGYARKTLMDTALNIFSSINTDGIIVNTDADCLFTPNYITEIEQAFENKQHKHGVMHFEHRIDEEKSDILAKGITEYELHLRFYKQALSWTKYPNVIHTIGSCMLCLASTYALEGGMNKRKAGEDFYFMNKLAKTHEFIEVKNASVLPSCRTSDRVPFGTGKAMNDYIEKETKVFQTYDLRNFLKLRSFIHKIPLLFEKNIEDLNSEIDDLTIKFLNNISINKNLIKIRKQSKDLKAFKTNFYFWFDHLKALQFIHYYTDNLYPKISIKTASIQFLYTLNINFNKSDIRSLLDIYRKLDKA